MHECSKKHSYENHAQSSTVYTCHGPVYGKEKGDLLTYTKAKNTPVAPRSKLQAHVAGIIRVDSSHLDMMPEWVYEG